MLPFVNYELTLSDKSTVSSLPVVPEPYAPEDPAHLNITKEFGIYYSAKTFESAVFFDFL